MGERSASWLWALALSAGCTIVPPNADGGVELSKEPGEPFAENVCFQCALQHCSLALRACASDVFCTNWYNCVAPCPTAPNGVSAEPSCVVECGLPVSAQVLSSCINEYSNFVYTGCEQACAPLSTRDAGAPDAAP